MEIWKGIESVYSVSSDGRVMSRKRGGVRILKASADGCGYRQVCICDGCSFRKRLVHLLVADAFLPPKPTPAHQINHKNGIPSDNRADNLEWMTPSENALHSVHVLGHPKARGAASGRAKLTETQVHEIRARRAAGELLTAIAADYGISYKNVQHIAVRRSWAWLE